MEELREARADREGPGDGHLYGTEPSFFALATNSDGAPTLVACRNDEFDVRKATVEETKGFAESDRTEWNSVTGMNAVRVWRGRDVQELRRQYMPAESFAAGWSGGRSQCRGWAILNISLAGAFLDSMIQTLRC